jgi:hypothetical protein
MSSLNTTVLAGGVVYPAGTAATPELRRAIRADFWSDGDDSSDAVPSYSSMKKDALEAEVAKRNEGREEADYIEVGGNGTVADLRAALEADDDLQG